MSTPFLDRLFANRFVNRATHKAIFGCAMLFCLMWSAASALHRPHRTENAGSLDR